MQYTHPETECYSETSCDVPKTDIMVVGEADENVTRGWYAILAQHEGWKAIVKSSPRQISRTVDRVEHVKHVSHHQPKDRFSNLCIYTFNVKQGI